MSNAKARHRRRWRWQSKAWKRVLGTRVVAPYPEVAPHRLILKRNEIHWLGERDGVVAHVTSRYPDVRAYLRKVMG